MGLVGPDGVWEGCGYICGKEVGTSGTPHLQGALYFKNPRSFLRVCELLPGFHIERMRGSIWVNQRYCGKDLDYVCDGVIFTVSREAAILKGFRGVTFRPWQQRIIDLVDGYIPGESCDRTIYWYWEADGNVGKSFLCKYLVLKYKALVLSGKESDIFNAVNITLKDPNAALRLVLVDAPRSKAGWLSYSAIEKVKDGLFFSGKYNSGDDGHNGMCVFNSPMCIVFANFAAPVGQDKMSDDRWNVSEIKEYDN